MDIQWTHKFNHKCSKPSAYRQTRKTPKTQAKHSTQKHSGIPNPSTPANPCIKHNTFRIEQKLEYVILLIPALIQPMPSCPINDHHLVLFQYLWKEWRTQKDYRLK
jgi:hypothetical protein